MCDAVERGSAILRSDEKESAKVDVRVALRLSGGGGGVKCKQICLNRQPGQVG